MTDKFSKVVDMYECLNIIQLRKSRKTDQTILEYDIKNSEVNRKFLEFQVKVILKFFTDHVKDANINIDDEEEAFMYMYTKSNIMKVFRDEFGDLPNKTIQKWSSKDINRTIKIIQPKIKFK